MTPPHIDWRAASAFAEPRESPGFNLWHGFMRWQRGLNSRLRPLGLTQPQFAILAVCGWLGRDGQDATQQDIASFLDLDRMLISQIATRLERQGLIERSAFAGDLRAKRITLTPMGCDVLVQALPVVEAFDREFFTDRA